MSARPLRARAKLAEARFFLEKLAAFEPDDGHAPGELEAFRYYVSAFVTASRSIFDFLRTEYVSGPAAKENFNAWFKSIRPRLEARPHADTLYALRNSTVHLGELPRFEVELVTSAGDMVTIRFDLTGVPTEATSLLTTTITVGPARLEGLTFALPAGHSPHASLPSHVDEAMLAATMRTHDAIFQELPNARRGPLRVVIDEKGTAMTLPDFVATCREHLGTFDQFLNEAVATLGPPGPKRGARGRNRREA